VSLYYLENYRTAEQLADMRRLEAAGICLFCPEHLAADARQRTVHRTAHWTVTPNEFPYAGTKLHLMLIPDEHVSDLLDLSPPAQADFWQALGWVREQHGLEYYGIAARNGDPRFTGGTIVHLHIHVIVGDPDGEPVKFKLGSTSRTEPLPD
jgi:diadenosine tetraphosphate (Ap4A) HIT family hydrolase